MARRSNTFPCDATLFRVRALIIVDRGQEDLLQALVRTIGSCPTVQIVPDRRYGERRQRDHWHAPERRCGDRRQWEDTCLTAHVHESSCSKGLGGTTKTPKGMRSQGARMRCSIDAE